MNNEQLEKEISSIEAHAMAMQSHINNVLSFCRKARVEIKEDVSTSSLPQGADYVASLVVAKRNAKIYKQLNQAALHGKH